MPRIARGLVDGFIYHVLNRGNGKQKIFHKVGDYQSFINLMAKAKHRHPLEIFGYCLMPNHFHIIVRPQKAAHLSRWMQWLMTSHVRCYHAHYKSSGHIWQGRFKSFVIQEDNHLLTVLRYIEGNPVKAGLVAFGLDWPWSSHKETLGIGHRRLIDALPIEVLQEWTTYVNKTQPENEIELLQRSINRQAPFGDFEWQELISKKLGLESTLRPRGRPGKMAKK